MFPTPYLTTAKGVLFADDCLRILAALRDGVVDCVFADPPFNLGKDMAEGETQAQYKARKRSSSAGTGG